ncbi:hypothetical protein K450DRAFT_235619 [Umbelopsis ramanniana AG]|uniref:UBZ4-type domain-containing protein n=1 Tax=Umbelopsis ramanniana AG TaxID=1314678 RepID=A0AAD5EC72_UMBRA|nr:uncharacterized protein K450DRAFT_235619 [Umbelopsis ramanniana AG]KAI8580717.1 hypothetical protein K450DRAFT_235619 [Umbelopsis ramanniana AG]
MDSNPFRAQSPYTQPGQQFYSNNQGTPAQQVYASTGNFQAQQGQFNSNQGQLGNGPAYAGNNSYNQPMTGYTSPQTMHTPSSYNSFGGSSMPTPSSISMGYSSTGYTQSMPQPQSYATNTMQATPNTNGYSTGNYQMPTPQSQYAQQTGYNTGYQSPGHGNQYGSDNMMGMNTGYYQQPAANPDNFLIPDLGVFSNTPSTTSSQPQRVQRSQQASDGKVRKVTCPVCKQEVEGDEPAINHHVNNHLDDAAAEEYKRQQSQPRLSDAQLARKLYVDEANTRYRY